MEKEKKKLVSSYRPYDLYGYKYIHIIYIYINIVNGSTDRKFKDIFISKKRSSSDVFFAKKLMAEKREKQKKKDGKKERK